MPRPLITLTTDFHLADAYVATMKAAILAHCPDACLIDVTHQIPPGDILCASITLERAIAGFPPGTIHLAVVDPGVGTKRRLLITQLHNQLIISPDNGLITWPWRRLGPGKSHELTWRPRNPSPTFHARDIMAPVAGMLAAGKSPNDLSRKITNPILLKIAPAKSPLRRGEIIHIDHFGNATTNIEEALLKRTKINSIRVGKVKGKKPPRSSTLALSGRAKGPPFRQAHSSTAPIHLRHVLQTYSDVPTGKPLALIGSSGLLEIAVRDGSAAKILGLQVGDEVQLE